MEPQASRSFLTLASLLWAELLYKQGLITNFCYSVSVNNGHPLETGHYYPLATEGRIGKSVSGIRYSEKSFFMVIELFQDDRVTNLVLITLAIKKIPFLIQKSDKNTINLVWFFCTSASGPTSAVSPMQKGIRRVLSPVLSRTSGWVHTFNTIALATDFPCPKCSDSSLCYLLYMVSLQTGLVTCTGADKEFSCCVYKFS